MPGKTVLFAQSETSNSEAGTGSILATTADVSCDSFKDALVADDLYRYITDEEGVLVRLSYFLMEDPEGDAWVGSYSPSGGELGISEGEVIYSPRTASTVWFDKDGFWFSESSGLLFEVTDYSSDTITSKMDHIWANARLSADNCGSY